jgi:hypothetical protein
MLPRYLKVPEQNIHFLNMPFYETGKLLCARLRGMIQYATSLHILLCCGLLWSDQNSAGYCMTMALVHSVCTSSAPQAWYVRSRCPLPTSSWWWTCCSSCSHTR